MFVAIAAMWLAMLMVVKSGINVLFLYIVVLLLTLILYWIGFRGVKR